jgi:hypothetical protein
MSEKPPRSASVLKVHTQAFVVDMQWDRERMIES